jgi:hypothetical protein
MYHQQFYTMKASIRMFLLYSIVIKKFAKFVSFQTYCICCPYSLFDNLSRENVSLETSEKNVYTSTIYCSQNDVGVAKHFTTNFRE